MKIHDLVPGASAIAFGVLAVLMHTSNGLAANPNFPPKCFHDVTVVNAAAPVIANADYRPNVWANALVTIGPSGRPLSATIVKSSGSAAIDRATVKAALSSTYSPAMSNCRAETEQYLFHVRTGPK
ncbi:MAG TPA: TonB family protein [Candidatus Baltobacteraceae bacterium]|nr:TonB family protein [Candidatus Baltobacteraceae bacterium]